MYFLFKDVHGLFPKGYVPADVEMHWYQWWESNNYFENDRPPPSERFSMLLPPPNITGNLHLGHALTCAIQDALVRW